MVIFRRQLMAHAYMHAQVKQTVIYEVWATSTFTNSKN